MPSTITEIQDGAFGQCRNLIFPNLPEGLGVIRHGMFFQCQSLTSLRVPSTVAEIEIERMALQECASLLSVKIPKEIERIEHRTFRGCIALVNIALPSTINDIEGIVFRGCDKLQQLFPDHDDLLNALKHRFDDLPIHGLCYYHSYHTTAEIMENLQQLQLMKEDATTGERGDAFGMTPFHILTLSAKPNLAHLFQELLDAYPTDLLDRKDKRPLDLTSRSQQHHSCLVKLYSFKKRVD